MVRAGALPPSSLLLSFHNFPMGIKFLPDDCSWVWLRKYRPRTSLSSWPLGTAQSARTGTDVIAATRAGRTGTSTYPQRSAWSLSLTNSSGRKEGRKEGSRNQHPSGSCPRCTLYWIPSSVLRWGIIISFPRWINWGSESVNNFLTLTTVFRPQFRRLPWPCWFLLWHWTGGGALEQSNECLSLPFKSIYLVDGSKRNNMDNQPTK